MKGIILIAAIVLGQGVAQADSTPQNDEFSLEISNKNLLSIHGSKRPRKIQLTHEIYGYEVNCSKTRALLWGKPKKLNNDNPQDSTLTIVNLKSNAKPLIIEFSKNIFDVIFLTNGINAIVESDSEWIIDATRGTLLSPSDGTPIDSTASPESCMTFPYKSYRKYKN